MNRITVAGAGGRLMRYFATYIHTYIHTQGQKQMHYVKVGLAQARPNYTSGVLN